MVREIQALKFLLALLISANVLSSYSDRIRVLLTLESCHGIPPLSCQGLRNAQHWGTASYRFKNGLMD
jgi:hypothetical protein